MSTKKVAVLDIASDVITLVVQDRKLAENYSFRATREYDGFFEGDFLDKEGLFKVIDSLVSECEKATFSKLDRLLVGVPGEFTAVTCKFLENDFGSVRKVTERDEEYLLRKGKPVGDSFTCINASAIYFELDDGTATVTPAGSGAVTQVLKGMVSYLTCENSFLDLLGSIGESLGLRFDYTSSVQAELLYVCPDNLRDEGVIVADVGYTTTSVAYGYGDGILHALSFSLGSGHVAADLMEYLGIPYDHAYSLLDKINLNVMAREDDTYCVSLGSEMAYYNLKKVNEVASNRVMNIAENIKKALDCSAYPVESGTVLLLTGSGIAHIPGAREMVQRIVGRPTEILVPDIQQLNKPRYSQVAGLLVVQRKQLNQSKKSQILNILKDTFSRRK